MSFRVARVYHKRSKTIYYLTTDRIIFYGRLRLNSIQVSYVKHMMAHDIIDSKGEVLGEVHCSGFDDVYDVEWYDYKKVNRLLLEGEKKFKLIKTLEYEVLHEQYEREHTGDEWCLHKIKPQAERVVAYADGVELAMMVACLKKMNKFKKRFIYHKTEIMIGDVKYNALSVIASVDGAHMMYIAEDEYVAVKKVRADRKAAREEKNKNKFKFA